MAELLKQLALQNGKCCRAVDPYFHLGLIRKHGITTDGECRKKVFFTCHRATSTPSTACINIRRRDDRGTRQSLFFVFPFSAAPLLGKNLITHAGEETLPKALDWRIRKHPLDDKRQETECSL